MERYRNIRTIRCGARLSTALRAAIAVLVVSASVSRIEAQDAAQDLKFANGLFQQRRYDLAADEYKRFLDANAKSTAPEVATATYALATCKLFLGQYAEARRAFEDFLLLAPEHGNAVSARFRVGETSYLLGDLDKAAKALKDYLATSPADHPQRDSALVYAGDVALRQEKAVEAEKLYRQSIETFPKGRLVTRAIFGLGRACSLQKKHDQAVEQFRKLREAGGKEWTERADYQIALELIAARKPEEAAATLQILEKASSDGPLTADVRMKLAEAWLVAGQEARAVPLLQGFAAADPPTTTSIQAVGRLAGIYLDRKDAQAVLTLLEPLLVRVESQPASAALLHQAAEAQAMLGRKPEARVLYEKLAKSFPMDVWANDARLRAAELAAEAKDYPAARRLLSALSGDSQKAPWGEDARLLAARLDVAEGQPAKAVTTLAALAETTQRGDIRSAASYQLALAYRALGQGDKARAVLGKMTAAPRPDVAGEPLLLLGQSDFEAGKFAEAEAALAKYLNQTKPRLADHALAWLAISQWETGKADDATATLARLEKDHPDSPTLPPTLLRLGEAASQKGNSEKAIDWLRRAARLTTDKPLRARAYAELGHALAAAKRTDESAAAFAQASELAEGDPAAGQQSALAAAKVLAIGGKSDEALAQFDKLIAAGDALAPAAMREACLNRARLLTKLGRHDDSAEAYETYATKFLTKAAVAAATDGDSPERILSEWAYAWLDAGKSDQADAVFRRLAADFPKSPLASEARVNMAESAYARKDFAETASLLANLAGSSRPDGLSDALREAALYRAARNEVERKQWADAETLWGRLVAEFPESSLAREAQFWRAEVALRTDRPDVALKTLDELLKAPAGDAGQEPAWMTTARLRRVQALLALKQWDDLLEFSAKLAVAPDASSAPEFGAEIDYARGRAFQATARFDEARTAYQAAIDRQPPAELAARARFMRGETFFHQKNYREALREFLKVDILHESPAWQSAALLEAAKVYERLNQPADATDLYQRLVDRFPNEAAASEARTRLRSVKPTASRAESPAVK
jgi:TolA-binding protein